MKITLNRIPVRNVFKGFVDNPDDNSVVGYDGKLNIRPKYQRQFVYNPQQQRLVMKTVLNGFPLNTMYWVDHGDGTFEVLDGQQRTLSICGFIDSDYSINFKGHEVFFQNLPKEYQDKILNYKLEVYFCKGSAQEKLSWFQVVNIAGDQLSQQELRNAVYSGKWVTSAKQLFSKLHAPAYQLGRQFVKGKRERQDYLQIALKWISHNHIEHYMGVHQHDDDAFPLYDYFKNVIFWIRKTFPNYDRSMKGVQWGYLYNQFHNKQLDASKLSKEVKKLLDDYDVTNKHGIYNYVLTGNESKLNIRKFNKRIQETVYNRQKGICPICHKHYDISEMEADHIKPWSKGGKTVISNCQMLCKHDNRVKSNN